MKRLIAKHTFRMFADRTAVVAMMQLCFVALLVGIGIPREETATLIFASFGFFLLAVLALWISARQSPTVMRWVLLVVNAMYIAAPYMLLEPGEESERLALLYTLALFAVPATASVYRGRTAAFEIGALFLAALAAQFYAGVLSLGVALVVAATAALSASLSLEHGILSRMFTSPSDEHVGYYTTRAMAQAWHCLLMQASVLLLLLFTDLLRVQPAVLSIQLKLLGLASLIVSAYLMIGVRRESVEFRMTVSTLLVGTVVSLSTMWPEEHFAFYAALPTLYIVGLTSVFHWSPIRHVVIVTWLAFIDVALRLGLDLAPRNRAAIVLVCLGALTSLLVSRVRQYLQRAPKGDSRSVEGSEGVFLGLRDELQATQLHSVLVAQRLYAGTAILLGSYLVGQHAASLFWLVVLAASLLFGIHLSLAIVVKRRSSGQLGWILAFSSFAVSALSSGIPLLYFSDQSVFYLFWGLTVALGLALSPWRLHELLTVSLISVVLLLESVSSLNLSLEHLYPVAFLVLSGLFISRVYEHALRESHLGRIAFGALNAADTLDECERRLAEVLLVYTHSQTCFYRSTGGHCLALSDSRLPLSATEAFETYDRLSVDIPMHSSEVADVQFAVLNLRAIDTDAEQSGFLAHYQEHALLFSIQFEVSGSTYRAEAIFLRPLPFFGVAGRFVAAKLIIELARMRVSRWLEERTTEAVRDDLRQQDALREYELSAMVHDINNTVQDLTLLCESIREKVDSEDTAGDERQVVADLTLIEATARSIAHIVSDAKRRRELEQLDDLEPREVVHVQELCADVLSFASLRAERKGIAIEVSDATSSPIFVRISVREHLEAVLRNLLQNAVAYSSSGSVIEARLAEVGQEIRIEVADNGIGLTEEELGKVFEQGYRGRVRDHGHGGLGLGLAQSRRVIDAAGGTLEGFSAGPGSGAIFRLRLPIVSVSEVSDDESWVLLVDDEPRLLSYYERLINACGLQFRSASSLAQVQSILEHHGRPTLVLSDLHLGVDQGEEVIELIRSRFGQSLPILVITGIRDTARTNRARAAGASDVIYKPIGQHALYARIVSCLPKERGASSRPPMEER